MIHDNIENIHQYDNLHPNFRTIFNIVQALNFDALENGHIELDGQYVYINIDTIVGRTEQESPLETHIKYIDIQIPLSNTETFGLKNKNQCTNISKPYNKEIDLELYRDTPSEYINVQKGEFIIFFPEDAHAPCITPDPKHRKMVIKVSVEPNKETPKL